MDENKTITNTNPDGAGEKTFTQDQVNQIVSDRLARDRAKGEAALAEREQQIAKRELLLTAKEKINEMGLPAELVDALNVSSPEALEKALNIVSTVLNKLKTEAKPFEISGAKPADSVSATPKGNAHSELRKAMRLP